jgi:small subunit ribosomal protein S1
MAEHRDDFGALLNQFEREQAGPPQRDPQVGDLVRGKVMSIGPQYVFVNLGAKAEGIMEVEALTDAEGHLRVAVGDTLEAIVTSKDEETGALMLGSQHGRRMHGSVELEHAFQHQLPVEGLVTGVTKGGVEVQIAGLRAFCPASQIDVRYIEDLSAFVGERLTFRVTRYEAGRHANLVVSRRVLLEEEQQARAAETRARLEVGAVLQGTVTTLKDYGAFVDVGGIEGMVHISELAYGHVKHPQEVLSVGQSVEVAVLRIERTDNPKHPEKIALSIKSVAPDPWQDAAERFPVGAQVKGTVTRLQPFGAFVELAPGIDGLVHISELGAGRRISHPREVLNEGDAVEATVLSVDPAKRRIGLSLAAEARLDTAAEIQSHATTPPPQPREGVGTFGELLRASMKRKK